MRLAPGRRLPLLACGVVLGGLVVAVSLGIPVDERMVVRPVAGQLLAGQSSGDGDGGGPNAYQKISRSGADRVAQYGFQNFNGDKLEVSYRISEKDLAAYEDSFGYTQKGLDELKAWRDRARKGAFSDAVAKGSSQAQLDAAVAASDQEYKRKLKDYLAQRGFRMEPGNTVVVDMPELIRRNAPAIKPLALDFERLAQKHGYKSPDIIGAVLSMVQTAFLYKQPDPVVGDKHNGGILPPLTSAISGWGDCDTKTGVLASVLANWSQTKMVGVSVPDHYLMGVLQIPEKGDTFVEYQGLQFVLVEPAGPAWLPPGHVGEETSAKLAGSEGYKIEPFF